MKTIIKKAIQFLYIKKDDYLKKRLIKKKLENISKGKINADYRMRFPNLKKGK